MVLRFVAKGLATGALCVAMLVLAAGPAFARGGSYWIYSATSSSRVEAAINGNASSSLTNYYGDPITFLTGPAGAELMDPGDQTPHANYVTTGGKCKVCHAVHGAGVVDATTGNVVTERLLRSAVADACSFCHISNNFATPVYQGDLANYTGGANGARVGGSGHTASHRANAAEAPAAYSGCPSCHAVHGANTLGTGTFILRNDPAKGVTSLNAVNGGWGSFVNPVTNQRDFCLDCHDGTRQVQANGSSIQLNTQAQFADVFKTCGVSTCHNGASPDWNQGMYRTQFGVTYTQARNGRSHVMTTQLKGGPGGLQLAWHATLIPDTPVTNSCTTCHNSNGDSFPHFAPGDDALIAGFEDPAELDQVCLSCHQTGNKGVGMTY